MKKKAKRILFVCCSLLVLLMAVLVRLLPGLQAAGYTIIAVARMWLYQADPEVQVAGCQIIAGVSNFMGGKKDWMLFVGAIDLPLAAMRRFPHNKSVQVQCAEGVSAASLYSYQNQEAAGNRGAVELVVDMMKRWPEDPKMQLGGNCGCFMDFSEENRRRFNKCGGIEVLLNAIENHFNDSEAVLQAWYGFSSGTQPPNAPRFVEAGGLDAGVKCMRLHGKSPRVREEVMQAFRTPLRHREFRDAMADAGYIQDLVTAMRESPMDYHQISPACANINLFTWKKNETHTQLAFEAGAAEAALNAVVDFPRMKPTVGWAPEFDMQYTVYADCLGTLVSMCTLCEAHKYILKANGIQIVHDMFADRAKSTTKVHEDMVSYGFIADADMVDDLGNHLLSLLGQPCEEGRAEAIMDAFISRHKLTV